MPEEKKGLSLRRKKTTRPTISAPRQISQTRDASQDSKRPGAWDAQSTASGTSSLAVPRDGSRPRQPRLDSDKTSDLVKRRYSTRFAGSPAPDGAPPMPAMPSMPAQYAQSGRGKSRSPAKDGRSPSRGPPGQLRVDVRSLRDPNLAAEKYVQSVLADASENDIIAYQNELQNVKAHTSTELQHNVYQNRTQFVKISKEAEKLKSEMRTLRTLLGELNGALGHATSAGGGDAQGADNALSLADRKRANRSSVADLEALWTTHLQTLWKRIEGSQKYLPALPGRHVITESMRWVELNAATWKPRRRVCLVLLNDHLLVASEKKRNDLTNNANTSNRQSMYAGQQSQATALIAERCWPLQDVSLADISSTSAAHLGHNNSREHKAISNALSVRAGNESFTYATTDTAEKASLLVAFRKAQEDLRKQLAAEHGERERQLDELALLSGRNPRLRQQANGTSTDEDPAKSAGGLNRTNSILIDVDGRQQSLRQLESQLDTLDIDIALQHFEDAVARTEKLRKMARSIKGNATAQEFVLGRTKERASKLATAISRQLLQASGAMTKTQQNVSWLVRLGYEETARASYLASRTETVRARTRQIAFTGPLEPYLRDVAFVTFTLLLHTFRTFAGSFPPSSGSAVVKWGKERVDEFNEVLERHLAGQQVGFEMREQCLVVAREQAAVLGEVGVDFKGLVGRGLGGEDGRAATAGGERAKGVRSQSRGRKRQGDVGLGVNA
ncbi:hypothetical protein MBLNU230_g1799t1 [Neophaeotheca triangularis]